MKADALHDIQHMFFNNGTETPAELAYNLTIVLNDVGNQLRVLADVLDEDKPWNINMTRSLVNGAAALLLQATPIIARLDELHDELCKSPPQPPFQSDKANRPSPAREGRFPPPIQASA